MIIEEKPWEFRGGDTSSRDQSSLWHIKKVVRTVWRKRGETKRRGSWRGDCQRSEWAAGPTRLEPHRHRRHTCLLWMYYLLPSIDRWVDR